MRQEKEQLQSSGIWDQWTADKYHQSSPKLAMFLSRYLNREDLVIDFGCGQGFYLHELASVGFRCYGVEGCKLNNFLHKPIYIHDLTQPIHCYEKGSVISLEVGEHLPKAAERTFLDTLTENCNKQMVISWALPGQPGIGHINCQPQEYIIQQLSYRGFKFLPDDTKEARQNIDDNTDWFRRTLMIFEREFYGERDEYY